MHREPGVPKYDFLCPCVPKLADRPADCVRDAPEYRGHDSPSTSAVVGGLFTISFSLCCVGLVTAMCTSWRESSTSRVTAPDARYVEMGVARQSRRGAGGSDVEFAAPQFTDDWRAVPSVTSKLTPFHVSASPCSPPARAPPPPPHAPRQPGPVPPLPSLLRACRYLGRRWRGE